MSLYDVLTGRGACPSCGDSEEPQLLVTEMYFGARNQQSFGFGDTLPAVSPWMLNKFRYEIAVEVADANYFALAQCPKQHDVAVRFEIRDGQVAALEVLDDQSQAKSALERSEEADRRMDPLLRAIFGA